MAVRYRHRAIVFIRCSGTSPPPHEPAQTLPHPARNLKAEDKARAAEGAGGSEEEFTTVGDEDFAGDG